MLTSGVAEAQCRFKEAQGVSCTVPTHFDDETSSPTPPSAEVVECACPAWSPDSSGIGADLDVSPCKVHSEASIFAFGATVVEERL